MEDNNYFLSPSETVGGAELCPGVSGWWENKLLLHQSFASSPPSPHKSHTIMMNLQQFTVWGVSWAAMLHHASSYGEE